MLRRALLPLLIGALALAAFQFRIRTEMVDFGVYRQAAQRVAHGDTLYQAGDGHYQFKYLPVFALLTTPLAWLDLESAKLVWFAASVGALVLLVRWSVRFLPERRRGIGLLIALTTLFMLKFYLHELTLGQTNIFFAVLVVFAIGALQIDARATGGALLGLAVCVKPYALLFAPWLIVNSRPKERQALIAFATVVLIALAAPMMVYGPRGNAAELAAWWRTVTTTTAPNLTGADNVSFAAMWTKWFGSGLVVHALIGLTSAAALLAVIFAWSRRPAPDESGDPIFLEASMLLVLIPLLSPQGWDYVLLVGTPAVALLVDRLPDLSRRWQAAVWTTLSVMAFTVFDVLGRTLYHLLMNWSIMTLCAVGVLVALAHLRRRTLA